MVAHVDNEVFVEVLDHVADTFKDFTPSCPRKASAAAKKATAR